MALPFLTKADSVAEWIRNEILLGRLAPGQQLLQEEIAARLGVSSTPVREAFGVLEAEGFLLRRPHRGVVVAQRSYSRTADTYEIRLVLETVAVRRAALADDPTTLDPLERALEDADRAASHPDVHAFRKATHAFHIALVKTARSPLFDEIMRKVIGDTAFVAPLDEGRIATAQSEHRAIVDALRRRDASEAAAVLSRHLDRDRRQLTVASTAERQSKRVPSTKGLGQPTQSMTRPRARRTSA